MSRVNVEVVKKCAERVRVLGIERRRVIPRLRLGPARARQVGGDHPKTGAELVANPVELDNIASPAGQQQNGVATAETLIVDPLLSHCLPGHRRALSIGALASAGLAF
jgi:hypothetical protein